MIGRAELVSGETGVTVCIAVRGAEIVGKMIQEQKRECDRQGGGRYIFIISVIYICLYHMVL
jgi:hypothetical protein